MRWDGFWCPCCGYRLRTRPRNLKYKAKLKARKEIEEAKILLSVRKANNTTQK
jgi:AmiR/NasT family two-component response regulator